MENTPAVIKSALKLAIAALIDYRRRNFAIGHNAFIPGQVFIFSERAHLSYERCTKAIDVLQELINKETF